MESEALQTLSFVVKKHENNVNLKYMYDILFLTKAYQKGRDVFT